MFAASKTSRLVPAGPTSDTYFNYVTSLLHADGTNGGQNNTFLDSSTNAFTITNNGDTSQGTFTPFNGGNYSNYFDGSGDYLSIPYKSAFVPSGDFTIECFAYLNSLSVYARLMTMGVNGGSANWGLTVLTNGTVTFYTAANVTSNTTTATVSLNTWTHIAVSRQGSTLRIFLNGSIAGTFTNSASLNNSVSTVLAIGADSAGTDGNVNGFISNAKITSGVALYTSSFTAPTTPLNTTSQTVLLTCASNRFEDLSGANNTITKNGDTRIQTFSPFVQSSSAPTSYSGYFDGSGDYLNFTGGTSTTLSGDFTVQCWVFINSYATAQPILCIGDDFSSPGVLFYVSTDGKLGIYSASRLYTGSTVITTNAWNHIAFVRSGTTITGYLNGVSQGAITNSTTFSGTTSYIARELYNGGVGGQFAGSISNLMLAKTAVYTSNFTPPTSPLTAVSGTSLLTCQSSTFIDNSSNAFAITVNGNSQPIKGNPFGYTIAATTGYSAASNGGSGYFDGNGDYLSVSSNTALTIGSGNATVEFWMYASANDGYRRIVSSTSGVFSSGSFCIRFDNGSFAAGARGANYVTSSVQPTVNQWYHVAWVGVGGTSQTLYLNGVQVGTSGSYNFTESITLLGGYYNTNTEYFNGYISNFRVLKGTALYTSAFSPTTSPFSSITNTQLLMLMSNASIIDNAEQNDFQTVGAAQISTSVKKYGTGSVSLNGTNSYLLTYYQPSQLMGAGNFTIEGWIYPTASTGSAYRPIVVSSIFNTFSNSDLQYMLYLQTSGYITFQAFVGTIAYTVQSSTTVSLNTWTYVAVVRNGATITLYVNGTSVSTSNISTNTLNSSVAYTLRYGGYVYANTFYYFSGNLDEFRITKGIARYTANFTPPVAALPNY